MKIFDDNSGWDAKVNFVDENNVFVGYDMGQCCCENADWFISKTEENYHWDKDYTVSKYKKKRVNAYTFDTNYFEEINDSNMLDSGGMVRFKLIAENKPDLYLHLFNCHNGYYRHGFEAKIGGQDWKDGYL